MSNVIFQPPAGLTWSVIKRPKFSTLQQDTTSKRGQLRIAQQVYPIWEYEFTWDYLLGGEQAAVGAQDSYQQLLGFYLARQGAYDSFLYSDPNDNAVTLSPFAIGDGSTTAFQLTRTIGSGVDIVQNVDISNGSPAGVSTPLIFRGDWQGTKNLLRASQAVGDANNNWVLGYNAPDTLSQIVTLNAAFAPDGSLSASKIVWSQAAQNAVYIYQPTASDNYAAFTPIGGRTFTFSVWLRSDSGSPLMHLQLGDSNQWQSAISQITLSPQWKRYTVTKTFSSTKNLIYDSDNRQGTLYWTYNGSMATGGSGAVSGNGFQYTGTGIASGFLYVQSKVINVVPGATYTLSGYIDASHVTSGSPNWNVFDPAVGINIFGLNQTAGVSGRVSGSFTVPAGVSQLVVIGDTGNCTVANGQLLTFSDPQLEAGSSVTAYDPNDGSTSLAPMLIIYTNDSAPLTCYAWGAQLEEGSVATTYQPTTTFDNRGPLYQTISGRQNSLLWSQDFENAVWPRNQMSISADSIVAPDGTLTADSVSGYRAINPPPAPTLSSTPGGSLGATTYFVKTTYVNPVGETIASAESSLAVSANNLLVVTAPTTGSPQLYGGTGWNVYVSTSSGAETKQAFISGYATNWTEPTSGLVSGAALPSSNTTASTDGFISQGLSSPSSFNGKYMTFSVYMKVPSGTLSTYIRIRSNGSTDILQPVTITTAWKRFTVQGTVASSLTSLAVILFGGQTINADWTVHIWGAQFENWGPNNAGTFPWSNLGFGIDGGTSYIPTTSAIGNAQDYTGVGANGIVTFNFAPASNAQLAWTGNYYYRLHFAEDSNDFEEFMYQFWTLKKIKLESVIL